jgi:hypothetical protein
VLNLALTKFTSTGEITTNFLLNDVKVWLMNTSATGGYTSTDWALLGFTSSEKTINPINEKYEREDKIPRVTTYVKTIRKGLEVKCGLSNQSAQLDSVINQGTFVNLGTTLGARVDSGTSEPEMQYRAVRFSADLDDGTIWTLTIPKCEIRQDGEKTIGGESETVTPLMFKAIYNPRAPSETRNLYYINYLPSGQSATADTAFGY